MLRHAKQKLKLRLRRRSHMSYSIADLIREI